jgi:hypothetical protein
MNSELDPLPSLPTVAKNPQETSAPAGDAEFSTQSETNPARVCPNCGAPAHGPYCYACGQSEKGMIRHVSEVMSDLADIVFNVDSRVFRSLFDLYFRPGFLTTEYIAGRRARYVTPFRLFFFLSILAFFSIQLVMPDFDVKDMVKIEQTTNGETSEDDSASSSSDEPKKKSPPTIAETAERVRSGVERAIEQDRATKRAAAGDLIAKSVDAESPAGAAAEPDCKGRPAIRFNGKFVDCLSAHNFTSLPTWLNTWLDGMVVHAVENFNLLSKEPRRLIAGWISVLPQTLFVLMPLFAVILKLFFVFKRRLYMEHLLVALHSHAFIFLGLIVTLGLYLLESLAAGIEPLRVTVHWLYVFSICWLFLYLLIMQKRVYRQGWVMTLIKFSVIGYIYLVVLSIALLLSAMISLAIT